MYVHASSGKQIKHSSCQGGVQDTYRHALLRISITSSVAVNGQRRLRAFLFRAIEDRNERVHNRDLFHVYGWVDRPLRSKSQQIMTDI